MIESRTITHYFAVCDSCDDRGPEAIGKTGAVVAAREKGWFILPEWNGLTNITTMLCPDCLKEIG